MLIEKYLPLFYLVYQIAFRVVNEEGMGKLVNIIILCGLVKSMLDATAMSRIHLYKLCTQI